MLRRPVALSTLLRGLGGAPTGRWPGVVVSGVSSDSRRASPGDLFFALPGLATHGGHYLAEAVSRGAVAVVAPPGVDTMDLPGLVHPDPAALLGPVAARLLGEPARRLTVAGVTGTNGKTTTALLLAHLLSESSRRTAFWTTTAVSAGGTPFRPKWTTPPAHELQRFLAKAVAAGRTHAVLEVSSHAVAQARIAAVPFAVAVVTNVSPDHLDFHGGFVEYALAKRAFVAGLGSDATAVLNADDPLVLSFGRLTAATVVTYGRAPTADARLLAAELEGAGSRVTVGLSEGLHLGGPATLSFRLPLPGRHNVANALAALAAALRLGCSPEVAAAAFERFHAPPRRLEWDRVGPYTVVNDVAMNEASYHTVFATLQDLGLRQPPVVVNALRGRRGPEINARIARILAHWNRSLHFSPLIATLSEDRLDRYPVDYRVQPEEIEAFLSAAAAGGLEVHLHETLAAAVAEGVARLGTEGLLLLLGTFGMDDGPDMAARLLQARLGLPVTGSRRYLEQSEETD